MCCMSLRNRRDGRVSIHSCAIHMNNSLAYCEMDTMAEGAGRCEVYEIVTLFLLDLKFVWS